MRRRRVRSLSTRIAPTPLPASTYRRYSGGAALGQATALGDDQRRPVPPRPAAGPDQRHVEARTSTRVKALGAMTGTQRTPEQTAIAEVWEATRSGGVLAGRALGRERAWPRRDRQRAPSGGGGDGHGRCADRRLRRQVHLQLLAAGHGHPQRRRRCPRIRPGHRSSTRRCSPSIRALTASCRHRSVPCFKRKIGTGPMPKLCSSSSTAGGAVRTWKTVGEFTQEVAVALIYDGVHYRNGKKSDRNVREGGRTRREDSS